MRSDQRTMFSHLAESLGVPFSIIRCETHDDVLRGRLRQQKCRNAEMAEMQDASEAVARILKVQLQEIDEFGKSERDHRVVSSAENMAVVFQDPRENASCSRHR